MVIADYRRKLKPAKDQDENSKGDGVLRGSILVLLAIACLGMMYVLIIYGLQFGFIPSSEHTQWSEFGDFFGGTVGTVFSFISLIALLVTIYLQNMELKATREELHETRKAQQAQASSLFEQVNIAKDDARSGVTFSMLERWSSPDMRQKRMAAWDHLTEAYGFSDRSIKLTDIKSQNADALFGLLEVCQFASDLNKMIKLARVDEELVHTLFFNSLYPWYEFIPRIDLESISDSGTLPHRKRTSDWYKEWVFSLQDWFEENQKIKRALSDESEVVSVF